MNPMKNNPSKQFIALILTMALVLTSLLTGFPAAVLWASAASPSLVITGTGVEREVTLTQSDWQNVNHPQMVERIFSSNNNFNFHKIWQVKGFDLFSLLEEAGLKGGGAQKVTFIAADGFKRTWTVDELKALSVHSDMTPGSAVKVAPMIGSFRTELLDVPGNELKAPVTWSEKVLSAADLDGEGPRLYLGQESGKVSDINQMNFIRDLRRIVVGEERSAASTGSMPAASAGAFGNSPYRHISYEGAPYHIDSITGATMTIEGPGVESYRALSLRQIEEEIAGIHRDTYQEMMNGVLRANQYEGIRVAYLLDHFVTLRENLGKVVFRDVNRRIIASFTLDEIRDQQRGMMVAYGINEVPLVYERTDAGYKAAAANDNGCFKLVYHPAPGEKPVAFTNVAYLYVEENTRPGFEHAVPPYNDPKLTNYIFALSGSGLGKEVNYTVAELESMTALHLEKEYSLSNSEHYWYYNTYKGIPLWDLLLASGMDENIDEATPVTFVAADYYQIPPVTVGDLKHHDRWGYYEKDALDQGDGEFDGSNVPALKNGYSVMVAYGFDGYPYVLHPSDEGHNSGLRNADGPLRIIFGKRSYDHTNGSHQVKFAKRVIIGDPVDHTTHQTDPYTQLKEWPLSVEVVDEEGVKVSSEKMNLSQVEALVYGGTPRERDASRVKAYYVTQDDDQKGLVSDLYEGIGLGQLLFEKIGLPGTMGTVTFENVIGETLTVTLADILKKDYFNEVNGSNNLQPLLAFGKNGYPLVKNAESDGYRGGTLHNQGGPLKVIFGQSQQGQPGHHLDHITGIRVQVEKDHWAHLSKPYDQYADETISFTGTGVRQETAITLAELELMQQYITMAEYAIVDRNNHQTRETYRGIDLYEYLRQEVGLTAGANEVKVVAADGYSRTFLLEEIGKRDYINEASGANDLLVLLAYGKNETPLVPDDTSEGYVSTVDNGGGPLRLVMGQTEKGDQNSGKMVRNVTEIKVTAAAGDSWKHNVGMYTQYLDLPVLRITGSQVKEPRTFSLRQLQALDEHIIRDVISGTAEVEGLVLWNLIKEVVELSDGVSIPSGIRVYAGPGYNQLQVTNDVMNGMVNSRGERKEILLGYALNGYPLVPHAHSEGYVHNNEYGPLRLYVEENESMWTKWVDCIVVGTGEYEEPLEKDLRADELPMATSNASTALPSMERTPGYTWESHRNDTGEGLPWASVRVISTDQQGGLWVGTNGGGAAYRRAAGGWTLFNQQNSPLPHNTVYDIAVDASGSVWFVGGSPESGMGIVEKKGEEWKVYTSADALPTGTDFAQAIAQDSRGGMWFGTAAGPLYRSAGGEWQLMTDESLPASSVTVLTPDDQGGLWMGFYPKETEAGYQGGYAYRNRSGEITVYSHDSGEFSGSWIREIAPDLQGGVWISRFGKNDYIDPRGNRTIYHSDRELLPHLTDEDSIRLIYPDKSGNGIWIGTTHSGLYHRSLNGTITVNHSENILPLASFDSIWTVTESPDGHLWVGTNGGIVKGVFGFSK